MNKEKLQWHPAFTAALRITLGEEMQYLDMREEYPLSKKPPQIDVLVIKKLREIAPEDLTITFVSNYYPKEMFRHLKETRNIEVKLQSEGIYYLKGDFIPMQFLYLPKLDKEENYWLQSLRNNLKAGEEIRTLMSNYEKNRKSKDYSAVMNLITRANWEQMEAEKKMCDALNELFAEELKEADLRGRAEGQMLGKLEGLKEGEKKFPDLTIKLIKDGRIDDVKKAAQDIELRMKLYQEYKIE